MVYHNVGIHALTATQARNLRQGKGVRMHLGSHHTIPMREDQVKKIHKAHQLGKASTIALDDGALHHLHGTGFFDVFKSIAPVLRQVATPLAKQMANQYLGPIGSQVAGSLIDVANNAAASKGYGIKRRGRPRKHYVHHDIRGRAVHGGYVPVRMVQPNPPMHGAGFMDVFKSIAPTLRQVATPLAKQMAGKYLGPIGSQVAGSLIDVANDAAASKGYGIHHKRRGRPRKHHGGALIASGY
jgi:hypothetical protein